MPVGAASWSFTEDDFAAITQSLQRFLHESNARCARLVDRSGQLVATVGEQPKFDPTAFATLTAADFSANDQLAAPTGMRIGPNRGKRACGAGEHVRAGAERVASPS